MRKLRAQSHSPIMNEPHMGPLVHALFSNRPVVGHELRLVAADEVLQFSEKELKDGSRRKEITAGTAPGLIMGPNPVSYTHLDVYKRQQYV